MVIQEPQNLPTTTPPPVQEQPIEEQESIDLRELLDVTYRRRWILLGCAISIIALGMVLTFLQRKVYESTGGILVTSGRTTRGEDLPLLADLEAMTQSRSVDTQVGILSSPDVLSDAFAALPDNLRNDGIGPPAVQVRSQKSTDLISITVRAYSPESAQAYVQSIVDTYLEKNKEDNKRAINQARKYVETQRDEAFKEFQAANTRLTEFKKHTGLVAPDAQQTQLAANIASLQMELDETTAQEASNLKSLGVLQKQFTGMDRDVVSSTNYRRNPQVAGLLVQLGDLHALRVKKLQEFTPKSKDVQEIDSQIAEVEKQLKAESEDVVDAKIVTRHPVRDALLKDYAAGLASDAALKARKDAVSAALRDRQDQLKNLPDQTQLLTKLMMDLDLQKSIVQLLTQKYYTLLISEGSTIANARMIARPTDSKSPVSPRVKVNVIIFTILGLLFGIAVVMVVERLDDRIHDHLMAERLTGLVIMGTIHRLTEDESRLVDMADKNSLLLERFRVLRNNISFSSIDRELRLIAVTSPGPGEGKSTCCANLGIVMARDGKRVLIVDCDLHRPSIHTLMKVPRGIGLTNVVMGTTSLDEAVVSTEHENLSFLPTGILPPNPSEFFNKQATRDLFRRLSQMYDIVILDCPPSLKLSDVQVISTIVDGMMILIAENQTMKRGLLLTWRALVQVSAPLIGLVVNRVDLRQHRYGYYGYYPYYYDYYYKYSEDGSVAEKSTRRRRGERKHRSAEKK
jgi:capsular exopolysaccharide synthesis family protein